MSLLSRRTRLKHWLTNKTNDAKTTAKTTAQNAPSILGHSILAGFLALINYLILRVFLGLLNGSFRGLAFMFTQAHKGTRLCLAVVKMPTYVFRTNAAVLLAGKLTLKTVLRVIAPLAAGVALGYLTARLFRYLMTRATTDTDDTDDSDDSDDFENVETINVPDSDDDDKFEGVNPLDDDSTDDSTDDTDDSIDVIRTDDSTDDTDDSIDVIRTDDTDDTDDSIDTIRTDDSVESVSSNGE